MWVIQLTSSAAIQYFWCLRRRYRCQFYGPESHEFFTKIVSCKNLQLFWKVCDLNKANKIVCKVKNRLFKMILNILTSLILTVNLAQTGTSPHYHRFKLGNWHLHSQWLVHEENVNSFQFSVSLEFCIGRSFFIHFNLAETSQNEILVTELHFITIIK